MSATGDFVSSVDLKSMVAACGGNDCVEDQIVTAATSQVASEEKGRTSRQVAPFYTVYLMVFRGDYFAISKGR